MDSELKRFRQSVRSQIREFVQKNREAPPLTLWASERDNPRRVKSLHVGAAASAAEVKAKIVEGIRERGSHYAAIGRLLHFQTDGEPEPTNIYGLVLLTGDSAESFEVAIVAGRVGAWHESVIRTEGEDPASAFFFAQQAIRGATRSGEAEADG